MTWNEQRHVDAPSPQKASQMVHYNAERHQHSDAVAAGFASPVVAQCDVISLIAWFEVRRSECEGNNPLLYYVILRFSPVYSPRISQFSMHKCPSN